MRFSPILPTLCFAAALVTAPTPVTAQFQRMAVAAGQFALAPRGSASLLSYCLDYTRRVPSRGTSLQHVLAAGEGARVIRAGRSYPLQHALTAGWVRVEGTPRTMRLTELMRELSNPRTLEQFTARMSAAERAQVTELVQEWRGMSTAQRADLDRTGPELDMGGDDYRQLRLVSNLDEPLRVEIAEPAVLGAAPERVDDVDLTVARAAATRDEQAKIQDAIWTNGNKGVQRLLRYIGAYSGELDGIVGRGTRAGIAQLQAAADLPAHGMIDAQTDRLLWMAGNQARLRDLRGDGNVVQVAIRYDPAAAGERYLMATGGGAPVATPDPAALVRRIVSDLSPSSDATVYLDLTSMRGNTGQAAAFERTLRGQFRQVAPNVTDIRVLRRTDHSSHLDDHLFRRGVSLADETPPVITQIASGSRAGWYQMVVDVWVNTGRSMKRVTLEFVARSKQALGAVWNAALGRAPAGTLNDRLSVAELVQGIRSDVRRVHPETASEIDVLVRDQYGASLYAGRIPRSDLLGVE